ncbi:MAG: CusA/CzcA family heavy metal efflux RND transporter [Muribaculaceae bacterium]|nr:CusA/CzcA family heavy metal efflux RND transporter [Muribaculaceae bacterium]
MLDKIIAFSLRNRLLIALAAAVIVVAGCRALMQMEVDVFPDLNAPTVAVMTETGGMAAEEVEQLVTYPIETALNGTAGVRRLRSQSTHGFSVVWVEFDWDTDVYRARQNVSERLAGVSLPKGVASPVMSPQTSVLGEVLFVGLSSDSVSLGELRTIADATIAPRLEGVPGVAQVSVIGGNPKEYQIRLRPDRMHHYGVSLTEVMESVADINRNASGGAVYEYGNEYLIRGLISVSDPEILGKSVVKPGTEGRPAILLENIAEVIEGSTFPMTGDASVNGREGVIMTVNKQPDTGTGRLTETLDKVIADIRHTLPSSVEINTDLYRQQNFIDSSIGNIKESLIEGAIFVCIILFVFLMNPRTTLISIVTIPLSMLMTFLVLRFMGLTINTMSIGGIAIAIGSLVDDAIVDVENVYRRLRLNVSLPDNERLPHLQVIFRASREVRMPILNSTLIIIVSFLPLFFLNGIEGRMLVPLGIAFILSLVASTIVALTLTPVLCSWLLPAEGLKIEDTRLVTALKRWYTVALTGVLRYWRLTVGSVMAIFVVALIIFFTFGSDFLPPFNEGSFTINVSGPPGMSLDESRALGQRAEKILMEIPEIVNVARKTGRAELDEHALGINVSEIEAPFRLDGRSKNELRDDIRHRLSVLQGANIEIGQPISHRVDAMLSGTQANVAIKVFGNDLMQIHNICKEIKEHISGLPGVSDVAMEQRVMRPQLKIVPDRDMMARYGLTIPQFAQAVSVITGGESVSEVYADGRAYDLKVLISPEYVEDIEAIRDIPVTLDDGRVITLSSVADITVSDGPDTVMRENLQRNSVVSVNVSGRDLGSVMEDIRAEVDEIELPSGVRVEFGGQFETARSASRTLLLTSFISILVILLLLYNQFRDWKQSGIVMLNLPLALIGGVFAIACSSYVVSIPAIIGFISLFGIATRNGMLLVDRYNELIQAGVEPRRAVLSGSVQRLNPIIMTALTSALALIPLAAGGAQPGNEIQSPMAKVILGGLISSTLLNGFIIPIMYLKLKLYRKHRNIDGNVGDTPVDATV